MILTNYRYLAAAGALLLASCAGRRPPFVVVPRAAGRSEEPVMLPLDPTGRARLEHFLSPVDRARVLDALENSGSLAVAANPAAGRFCDFVESLCAAVREFRGKAAVRQVIDARESRRPFPAPLAVRDGPYWWIFRVQAGRLAAVLIVRDITEAVTLSSERDGAVGDRTGEPLTPSRDREVGR